MSQADKTRCTVRLCVSVSDRFMAALSKYSGYRVSRASVAVYLASVLEDEARSVVKTVFGLPMAGVTVEVMDHE